MMEKAEMLPIIEAAIEQIRPYMKADGGDVLLKELTEDLIVRVELLGACSSCSMSPMTLKAGLEENIKLQIPEIKGVEAVKVEQVY